MDFSWYFNEVCVNNTKSSVRAAAELHIQTFDGGPYVNAQRRQARGTVHIHTSQICLPGPFLLSPSPNETSDHPHICFDKNLELKMIIPMCMY